MMSRSFESGQLVCTRCNALCISTLALRVSTPDSIASDVALEKRVGRERFLAQSKANGLVSEKKFKNFTQINYNELTLI